MGERVRFKSNGSTAAGYLSRPGRPGPGIVVIQEWWGLVPHIEHVADRFAAEGFVALAPDLYHGKQAKSPDEAGKLMMAMRIDEAERDLSGAIDYLAAENSPSLVQHYWSLAVEEQFYLVWPLLILGAVAIGRSGRPEQRIRRVRWVLVAVFLVSLALSIVATPKDPALAFFATPLRAWQFAAGGLLAMSAKRAALLDPRVRAAASWFGWVVIIGATLFMQGSHVQFPGWIALVPVVAAVCCLGAGDPSVRWAPGWLIRNRAVQWTGARSYSIYLWHWPLIILAPWVLGGPVGWPVKFVLIALTALLAWATKHWVEDPVRTGEDLDRGRELVALDLGDGAREPVPHAGGGDLGALAARGEEPGNLRGGDPALAARRPGRLELALALPAAKRLHPHAEHRSRLTDPVRLLPHGAEVYRVRSESHQG